MIEDIPCTGEDPELFFPPSFAPIHNRQIRKARKICLACPVRSVCLNGALEQEHGLGPDNRWGVRGGMTPNERWRLARERKTKEEGNAA